MAETQSAPSLRELSERAPQGEWTLEKMPNDAGSRSNAFTSFGIEADGKTLLDTLNATGMYLEQEPDGDGGYDVWDAQGKAVIDYVLALVQAHRAGRLIDPTTLTEAVASARADGIREGLERAAEVCDLRVSVWRHHIGKPSETEIDEQVASLFENAAQAIRALITAPPTTPGGRTDG